MTPHPCLKPGNVAVITGAGFGGIGYATALVLATRSGPSLTPCSPPVLIPNCLNRFQMKVLLADIIELEASRAGLIAAGVPESSILTRKTDVADAADVFELADLAFSVRVFPLLRITRTSPLPSSCGVLH